MPSGIPRIRTKYELSPGLRDSPTTGWKKLPLGTMYLETSPGHLVKIRDESSDIKAGLQSGKCCRDYLHSGPPYRQGDDLWITSVELPNPRVQASGRYNSHDITRSFYGIGTGRVHYVGGFWPLGIWQDTSSIPALVTGQSLVPSTTEYELRAYKRCRPRIQKASAFVFAAEMRDIPRMLRSTSRTFHDLWSDIFNKVDISVPRRLRNLDTMQPKKAADTFLNHQFGWSPFINDLSKFYTTFQNAAAIKSQLTHDNGRYVRRRVVLDDKTESKVISSGVGMGVEPLGDLVGTLFTTGVQPRWQIIEETHDFVSAVGSFKYYRPEFDASLPDYNSAWNTIQRQVDMYGLRISPSNVYRATPWTWLVDWCTDFGNVIDAFDDMVLDSVAAQYLYVMRHTTKVQTFYQTLPFWDGAITASWPIKTDGKVRRGASTPYGFGLTWNLLTPRQLAILAALKITH